MAKWRSVAIELLPELREKVAAAETIGMFWIDLWCAFQDAYRADPINDDFIARMYAYADWCLEAPRIDDAGRDPFTMTLVNFLEDIPNFPPACKDMPRWFRYEEVANNRQLFAYHVGDRAFDELVKHVHSNRHRYRPRARDNKDAQ